MSFERQSFPSYVSIKKSLLSSEAPPPLFLLLLYSQKATHSRPPFFLLHSLSPILSCLPALGADGRTDTSLRK